MCSIASTLMQLSEDTCQSTCYKNSYTDASIWVLVFLNTAIVKTLLREAHHRDLL